MTATQTEQDLSQLVNKKVILVRNLKEKDAEGNLAVEVEGTIQAWNPDMGLLVKPKGKVNFELIPAGEIEPGSVKELTDSNQKLKRAKLQHVKPGQARRHLLERHGLTLAYVNGLTEDQAMEVHGQIDHEANDLGHVHVDKKDEDKKNDAAADDSEPAGDES